MQFFTECSVNEFPWIFTDPDPLQTRQIFSEIFKLGLLEKYKLISNPEPKTISKTFHKTPGIKIPTDIKIGPRIKLGTGKTFLMKYVFDFVDVKCLLL